MPGNVLPLADMPPGTVINNVEKLQGDKGKFAKTSGGFAQIIGHIEGANKVRVRMPSGQKKTLTSNARAAIGIVAGGGRIDKPMLKAGRAFHKFKAKRNSWPKVRSRSPQTSAAALRHAVARWTFGHARSTGVISRCAGSWCGDEPGRAPPRWR